MALRGNLCRFVGVGLIAGVASLLGACGVSEKDYNAMKSENEDLRQRVAASDGQLREKDAQVVGLQEQLKQQQAVTIKPQNDNWEPGTNKKSKNGNSGGGDVVIEVAGDVLFGPGQATLKADAKKELDGIARTLKSKYSGHNYKVIGYTDTDKPSKGKYKSNEALSEARAAAVAEYLMSKGVSSGAISSVGMGAAKPKATKKDSRRVEIVVVGT